MSTHFTHTKRGEVICDVQDIFNGVTHSADYPIDDMHHTICGHLVTVDDPGTVHCHNLHTEEMCQATIIPDFYGHNSSIDAILSSFT